MPETATLEPTVANTSVAAETSVDNSLGTAADARSTGVNVPLPQNVGTPTLITKVAEPAVVTEVASPAPAVTAEPANAAPANTEVAASPIGEGAPPAQKPQAPVANNAVETAPAVPVATEVAAPANDQPAIVTERTIVAAPVAANEPVVHAEATQVAAASTGGVAPKGFTGLPEDVRNQENATAQDVIRGPMVVKIVDAVPANLATGQPGEGLVFDVSAYNGQISQALDGLGVSRPRLSLISQTGLPDGKSRFELAVAWQSPNVDHQAMHDALNQVIDKAAHPLVPGTQWQSQWLNAQESVQYQLDSIARSQAAQTQTAPGHVPQPQAEQTGVALTGKWTDTLKRQEVQAVAAGGPAL